MTDAGRELRELSSLLGWEACIGMAMLGAYFDESYEHDRGSGHAIRMTMGGCIASPDNWARLSDEWSKTLRDFKIPMFHMTDFEANEGYFKNWKENRTDDRGKLLNKLLDLMASHVELYLGTFVEVMVLGKQQKKHYQALVRNTVHSAADAYRPGGGKTAIVFARHKDFSEAKAEAYTSMLMATNDPDVGPVTLADPCCIYPLQAADIFAYELSRYMRFDGRQRYPFRRIVEDAGTRGVKVVTQRYKESFRADPRASVGVLPGTALPRPSGEV